MPGAIISRAFVEYRHPLGWGAGLQGRWRHRPPSLLHWDIINLGGYRENGRKAEGFSPHRTNNQGGHPPYLRAAIVPGRGRAALPWDPPSPWLYGGGYHLGGWKQAIIFRAVWRQPRGGGLPPPKLLGAHPLGGGRTGYGCRRQPPTMRHKPKEGATDCAHIGWGGGGIVC